MQNAILIMVGRNSRSSLMRDAVIGAVALAVSVTARGVRLTRNVR